MIRYEVRAALLATSMLAGTPVVAQTTTGATGQATAPGESGEAAARPGDEGASAEIVVTASRREQSIVDTPYNVSAFSGETLARANVTDVSALSRFSPGISVLDIGNANRSNRNPITIRGLNVNNAGIPIRSDGAVPTVAQYVGETPVQFPVKFFDVERVEVLRGPQGTLYGSGSLAGTLRVLPRAPQLGRTEGYAYGALGKPGHSDEIDWQGEAAINLPLGERAALRIAGGYEHQAGFIDSRGLVQFDANGAPTRRVSADPNSGFVVLPVRRDTNDSDRYYARAAIRLEPSDTFDVTLSHEYQRTEADNPQEVNPDFPGLNIDTSVTNYPGSLYPNTRGFPNGRYPNGATFFPAGGDYSQYRLIASPARRTSNVSNLLANLDVGFATLTSSTSYVEFRSRAVSDRLGSFSATRRPNSTNLASFYGYYPRLIAVENNRNKDRFFTQELRLVSDGGETFDYVLGAFYQHQKSRQSLVETIPGVADYFGLPAGSSETTYTDLRDFTFRDVAVFGELTWHITPEWQVTGGVRQFWQKFTLDGEQTYPVCGAFCANDGQDPNGLVQVPNVRSKVDDRIFKLNTSYKVTPDASIYATYSEGFRRGGANGVPTAGIYASLPQYITYRPDKVSNYEVGGKARVGSTTVTLAGFIEEWKDFQFENVTPSGGAQVVINGSKARTQGIELELTRFRDTGVSYSLGYTYVDAKVSRAFTALDLPLDAQSSTPPAAPIVAVSLAKGDKLPGVPPHTVTGLLAYGAEVGGNLILRGQVDGSYRSRTFASFPGLIEYGRVSGFALVNLQLSLERRDRWTATAFVDNVGDVLGATAGAFTTYGEGALGSHRFVVRPRTVGVRLRYAIGG